LHHNVIIKSKNRRHIAEKNKIIVLLLKVEDFQKLGLLISVNIFDIGLKNCANKNPNWIGLSSVLRPRFIITW